MVRSIWNSKTEFFEFLVWILKSEQVTSPHLTMKTVVESFICKWLKKPNVENRPDTVQERAEALILSTKTKPHAV